MWLQLPAHASSSLADFSTLKMEAIRSSETSVHIRSTRRHIPEDGILHSHRRENLISYNIKLDLQEGRSKGVDCIHLAQDGIQGCFEHSNKSSISINDRKFLDYLGFSSMILLYGISGNCKAYIMSLTHHSWS
jgi:hypothetical protein